MACLWIENSREQTLESSYTQMREDEVMALRRANTELRREVELLREELWNIHIANQASAQPAQASAKSYPTPVYANARNARE